MLAPCHLHSNLGKVPVDFILDSGASYSCIDTGVWNKIQHMFPRGSLGPTKVRLYSANADAPITVHGEATLKVDVDGSSPFLLRAVIANIGEGKWLMGAETFTHIGGVLSYPDRSLTLQAFGNYHVPLRADYGDYVASVTLLQETVIPARSAMRVDTKLRECFHFEPPAHRMFAPNAKFAHTKDNDTMIPYCLVPDSGNNVAVTIMNSGDVDLTLEKGTNSGTLSNADYVDETEMDFSSANSKVYAATEGTEAPEGELHRPLPDHLLDMLDKMAGTPR